MEQGERLAAYLAGDLDADEARRLEGELARDPSLRDRLARLRRLEEALTELPPVELPTAFSARLRDAVQQELDGRPVAPDELAARRRRRGAGLPSWLPATAGAAAALVAVVAIGVSLSGVGGGDDAADEGAEPTAMRAEEADGGAADDTGADAGAALAVDGPVVVSDGSAYDADEVQARAGEAELGEIAGRSLTDEEAAELAERYRAALGSVGGDADASTEADEGAEERPTESADREMAPPLRIEGAGEITPEDLEAVGRCLGEVLAGAGTPIPVYAELATFEGTDAIVYGLVTHDPSTGRHTRSELWVVAPDSCEVLFFAQRGATD